MQWFLRGDSWADYTLPQARLRGHAWSFDYRSRSIQGPGSKEAWRAGDGVKQRRRLQVGFLLEADTEAEARTQLTEIASRALEATHLGWTHDDVTHLVELRGVKHIPMRPTFDVMTGLWAVTLELLGDREVPPDPPAAPTALAATSIGPTSFQANWEAVATAENYRLDVATDSGFTALIVNDLNVGNVTSHAVSGLENDTSYWYRVRAENAAGVSDNSNVITLTTPDIHPYALLMEDSSEWITEAGDPLIREEAE